MCISRGVLLNWRFSGLITKGAGTGGETGGREEGVGACARRMGVPETILKKRKRDEQWAAKREAEAKAEAAKKEKLAKEAFTRAEKYVAEYRAKEADLVRLRREAKAAKGFHVDEEAKLAFVVRIRGINDMHPKVRAARPRRRGRGGGPGGRAAADRRRRRGRERPGGRRLTPLPAAAPPRSVDAGGTNRRRRFCSCCACAK